MLVSIYFNVTFSLTFVPHDRQTATNCVENAESFTICHGSSKAPSKEVK